MFLMGIPICFFMIGLLYFVFGIGEELVLRERIQDAADAGALSAAIVHARAMNLIALLNQVMAALVSLLVMVRMLEALLIVAMALATALAWPTAGASLSIVPGAEVAREEAANAFDALKEVVGPLVQVLHGLEIGIQYGMPAVAELRVIEIVKKYKPVAKFGFAIPGEYPLPLKNGDWGYLCQQAGFMAGKMIAFPIETLIPVDAVSSAIGGAVGTLAKTFPQTFCGEGGLVVPPDLPAVPLDQPITKSVPPLKSSNACSNSASEPLPTQFSTGPDGLPVNTAPMQAPTGADGLPTNAAPTRADQQSDRIDAQEKVCMQAAMDQAMAMPAEDGSPNTHCVYKWQNDPSERACDQSGCLQGGQPCDQFKEKVEAAATQCRPGETANITKYHYQQLNLSWRAELIPVPNCGSTLESCKYTIKFATSRPEQQQPVFVDASQPPCGTNPKGSIGPEYRSNARWQADGEYEDSEYMCIQPHTLVEPSMLQSKQDMTLEEWQREFKLGETDSRWTATSEPYVEPPRPDDWPVDAPWPPPSQQPPSVPSERVVFVGAWSAVTYLHSCDQTVTNFAESDDYKDQAARATKREAERTAKNAGQQAAGAAGGLLGGSGGGDQCGDGEGDEVHLELKPADKDNVLGGETFQMRAIAIRKSRTSGAKKVVRNMPLRLRRSSEKEQDDSAFSKFAEGLNHIFAAQAEYYFDTDYDPKKKDELDKTELDRKEWTWNMYWKARMRRLRFLSDDSSQDSSGDSGGSCEIDAPSGNVDQAFGKASNDSESDESGDSSSPNSGSDSVSALKQLEGLIIH
jgi:hypothetical protein